MIDYLGLPANDNIGIKFSNVKTTVMVNNSHYSFNGVLAAKAFIDAYHREKSAKVTFIRL